MSQHLIPPPRNIVLTGFMGTGKTTVGERLARRLGWEFVDTDAWIVEHQGCSVAEIFELKGEAAFRQLETEAARELAKCSHRVIATGGRLMLDGDNAALLCRDSRVFCLHAAPAEILRRIRSSPNRRPLLAVARPESRIEQLLAERREGYGQFEAITTDGLAPRAVVEEILRRLDASTRRSGERRKT